MSKTDVGEWLRLHHVRYNTVDPYKHALRHRSVTTHLDSNEVLEFLGDTVLSTAISAYLIERYPRCTEGFFTKMRSQLVKGSTLASLAREMRVHEVLDAGVEINDDMLEDALEALIGAMFKDMGYNATSRWIVNMYEKRRDFSSIIEGNFTPRDRLVRHSDITGKRMEVESEKVVDGYRATVKLQDQVVGVAQASSRREAVDSACKSALRYVGV